MRQRNQSPARTGTEWERLRNLTDAEVQRAAERDPDARPTDAEFWKSAHLVIPAATQDR
jgi:hypothetical protein